MNRIARIDRILACVALVLLAACGTDEGWRPSELPARPQTGEVQIVNLIPDSPSIEVTIGGRNATVEYGQASSEIQIGIGDYELSIGYLDADGEGVLLLESEPVTLTDRDKYVYLLRGTITQPTIETSYFVDPQYGDAIALGTIEVWFANASTAVTEVDIYLTEPGVPLADSAPLATVAAGGTSEVFTVETLAQMQLRITASGTLTLLFDSGAYVPFNGSRLLVSVLDYFGPTSAAQTTPIVAAARISAAGTQPYPQADLPSQLRVVDLVADVAQLDVYFGSTSADPLVGGIAPGEFSPFVDVSAGLKGLNVTRTGIKDQFLVESDLFLTAGNFYSLLLTGTVADDSVGALLTTTVARPIYGRVTAQFMNAAAGFSNVNLYLLIPGQPLAEASPEVSGSLGGTYRTLTVRPTIYDIVVTSGSGGTVIYGPERVQFDPAKSYALVLVEDVVGSSSTARLMVLANDS